MTEIENTTESIASSALLGRELPSAINSPELLEQHSKINGTKVRTR